MAEHFLISNNMEITAKEFMKGCEHDGSYIPVNEVERLMIEFAKEHVRESLKNASEKAIVEWSVNGDAIVINKNSILNSYLLENIK